MCNWLLVLARKSIHNSRSSKIRSELPDGVLYNSSQEQNTVWQLNFNMHCSYER